MGSLLLDAWQGAALHLLLKDVVDHVETSAFGIGLGVRLVMRGDVAKLALFRRESGCGGMRVVGFLGGLELSGLVRGGFMGLQRCWFLLFLFGKTTEHYCINFMRTKTTKKRSLLIADFVPTTSEHTRIDKIITFADSSISC